MNRSDILTVGGHYFDILNPEGSQFSIEDIAHALSHLCRFTGHTRTFYSVAQHSVHVAELVPAEYRRAALLHDAAEAFIGDVSKPLKNLLPDYQAIERRVEAAIFARFGLPAELPETVKVADQVMLTAERRDMMPARDGEWVDALPCSHVPMIYAWSPEVARAIFLREYSRCPT